jgi:hypothetical protein
MENMILKNINKEINENNTCNENVSTCTTQLISSLFTLSASNSAHATCDAYITCEAEVSLLFQGLIYSLD